MVVSDLICYAVLIRFVPTANISLFIPSVEAWLRRACVLSLTVNVLCTIRTVRFLGGVGLSK